MHRFKNILYCAATNASDESLRRAADLAHGNGARLTLHSVVPEPTRLQRLLDRRNTTDAAQHALVGAASNHLQELATTIGHDAADRAVDVGNESVEIIRRVVADDHDLVVIADRATPHSTTVRRLLRKCPCSVLVLRPTPIEATSARVLAAVNPADDEHDLNTTILELATSMVDRFGGQLHIAHAWEMYAEPEYRNRLVTFTPAIPYEQLRAETETGRRDALQSLLAEHRSPLQDATIHLEHGAPHDVLSQIVRDQRITTIVMGTLARSGLNGLFIGNIAEQVLDDAPCSTLTLKPDGFCTPVTSRPPEPPGSV